MSGWVSIAVTTGKGANGLSLSEEELVRDAKRGDREAFCALARCYERRLFSLALHYSRDVHEAEDLSQDVWLKAYRAVGGFRGDASFYTWLRRIAINTFLNYRRGAKGAILETGMKTEAVSLEEINEVADGGAPDVEEGLHRKQLVGQVTRALSGLSPQERLIFLLKHREEISCEEIAEACEVSTGTVKKSLFRAVNKIREQLGVRVNSQESVKLAVK